jgi:predicted metal-dependent hydrolase
VKPSQGVSRSIQLNGCRLEYLIRESRTARRCRIRVTPAGVEVVLPCGGEESRAADFLRDNASWVLEQLAFLDRMGSVRVQKPEDQPDTVLLRGQKVRVEVVREPSRRTYAITEQEGPIIRVRVPETSAVDSNKALEAWLRRQARHDITARLAIRSTQMRVRPGRVYIMGQRTKWGGCSRRRNLSFNWRLIMAPAAALDYIVVHELAHLIEPYHSTKFWLIVRSHCPEFESYKRWLSDNQERLGLQR